MEGKMHKKQGVSSKAISLYMCEHLILLVCHLRLQQQSCTGTTKVLQESIDLQKPAFSPLFMSSCLKAPQFELSAIKLMFCRTFHLLERVPEQGGWGGHLWDVSAICDITKGLIYRIALSSFP